MAKKIVYGIGLLPDGRALRVVKVDTRRMLEINKRVGAMNSISPVAKAEDIKVNANAMQGDIEKATIALCVRAITLAPVEPRVMRKRKLTAEEIAAWKSVEGAAAPAEIDDGLDVAATVKPLIDNPQDPRWTPLGEQSLANDDDENALSMFSLFDSPRTWRAALGLINAADDGGANSPSPFVAQVVKTSGSSSAT